MNANFLLLYTVRLSLFWRRQYVLGINQSFFPWIDLVVHVNYSDSAKTSSTVYDISQNVIYEATEQT